MIELTLPYPVSANRYWRTYMPKGFKAPVTALSAEAKDYRAEVVRIARRQGIVTPISGRVAISVGLFPRRPIDFRKRMRDAGAAWDDSVQCIDLDNALKVLIDSIKDVVIADDKWVWHIMAARMEPDDRGARAQVSIDPIEARPPQLDLLPEPPPTPSPRRVWADPLVPA